MERKILGKNFPALNIEDLWSRYAHISSDHFGVFHDYKESQPNINLTKVSLVYLGGFYTKVILEEHKLIYCDKLRTFVLIITYPNDCTNFIY